MWCLTKNVSKTPQIVVFYKQFWVAYHNLWFPAQNWGNRQEFKGAANMGKWKVKYNLEGL